MKMEIVRSTDKKRISDQLKEQFGISKVPYLLLRFGKEKIRAFSGSLLTDELRILDHNLRIEAAGLYLGKQQDDGIRLNLDAIYLLKDQITKNILELTDEQTKEWFSGHDLILKGENSFKILKNNGEIIGCGKSTGEKITNFMPKERRIKN
jgi:NOL1/NOP2/fmu family ribosome biogenesis protein